MIYGYAVINGKTVSCGYFPSGKNWYVRYSVVDQNGLMTGIIIQNGQEIAIREIPSTAEELNYFAKAYMTREET